MVYQLPDIIRRVMHTCRSTHIPLSTSLLGGETMTGTYHPSGFVSSISSWPSIARWMASSLPGGGAGTLGSHAMLMNTFVPFGMGMGVVGSRSFGSEGAGGSKPGVRVDDLTQKPGLGLSSVDIS